jgi:peptide/nickel transport system permease protein
MGFRSYLVRRLVIALLMLFVVMTINYALFFIMPGSPTTLFVNPLKGSAGGKEEFIKNLQARWGFDKPPLERFGIYVRNMLTWNLGISLVSNQPISSEMLLRLWWTMELMGGSAILGILIGVALGVLVAYKRGGKFDTGMVTFSLVTYSLPVFWMGMIFILIFTVNLHLLPSAAAYPYDWDLPGIAMNVTRMPVAYAVSGANGTQWNGNMIFSLNPHGTLELLSGYISHLIMPLAVLTLFTYGGYLLLTRATMIEALTEDYIVTAKAKGVPERNVIFRHALKNASLPLITTAALHFGFMLGGAIITESVFSWPGMGTWIFAAIGNNDYGVLQAVFYIIGVLVIIANIIADVLYGIIDPRIKYG